MLFIVRRRRAALEEVSLPIVVAKKLQILLAGCDAPMVCGQHTLRVCLMPNQRHPDKTTFSVSMDRELHRKLKRLADKEHRTVSNIISLWTFEKTQHINLAPEDYEEIAAEIRSFENKRQRKQRHN